MTPDPAVLSTTAAALTGVGSLTFSVDGAPVTYRAAAGGIEVTDDSGGDTLVRLNRPAWEDLVGQLRTFIGLFLSGDLVVERGSFDTLAAWDPALKYLHAGIEPYDPGRSDLGGRRADVAFGMETEDEELRAQLRTMGFLHLRGVFSAEEMAAANAEVDRLAALARPGDDESWWVTAESGEQALCRLVYASLRSELLASIDSDPRVTRLGTLLDPSLRIAPDRMEGSAVLLKVPGRTKGLSNIPWHTDCGMGGHAVFCPAVAIGIQLTGSTAETGNLTVVPGSHGRTLPYQWQDRLRDVPVVEINTEPGDVTVHVQDVMHASPRPAGSGGRRTMYVTHYPSTLWDHIGPGEAYNDLVRNRTQEVARLG